MGLAKRYMEEVEARGWIDVGTTICSECVIDPALGEAIKAHGGTDPCDYCKKTPTPPAASAPFEVLIELVVEGLRLEYEDPVEQMAYDAGYVGTVYDTYDLLWELEITDQEDVHHALLSAIQKGEWCQRDPYGVTRTEALTWGWDAFRKFVKHTRRFTFLTTDHSTADGEGSIPMHAMPAAIADAVEAAELVKALPEGSEFWRVRAHAASKTYTSAADLGAPPDAFARDNRMSPKGIGVFYGASTKMGARAEVAGYAAPTYEGSVGLFKTVWPLDVVDLRELPAVPSLFDLRHRHLRAPIQFLHGFVEDVTQIADPSDIQNLEYVPTQVVAETLRYELSGANGPVTGILWRSSKDPAVTSCVLFIPSDAVADLGHETDRTRLVLDPATVEHITAPL